MSIANLDSLTCSIARTVATVGDPWSLMILKELFLKNCRFGGIQAMIGISPHLLSVRMRTLESAGIVCRHTYLERPKRYEYRLTEKGIDLWPLIITLKEWGERWHEWPSGAPLQLRHKSCGHEMQLKLACSCCGDVVGPRDVTSEMSGEMVVQRQAMAIAQN
ncbi:helix-turn-helix domain-containing protein [Mesorhizobium sp. DCY119]|uniref:winged helix-turn-helix transcriptional regulator n=1 Tax=Mesorhizobium sp. DCY119 TaxID=2108445 RepID=UPI000E724AB9|nr:helix-turn-helix domain-containing protein [Mesorhizobium sp. DCY119]RJG39868.1 transcriptional regulator [Mesorhizobium sp. DCY119]